MSDNTPAAISALLDASPCDGCELAEKCEADGMACGAFALFVDGEREETWRSVPRIPLFTIAVELGLNE